jgi:hypothetical protein
VIVVIRSLHVDAASGSLEAQIIYNKILNSQIFVTNEECNGYLWYYKADDLRERDHLEDAGLRGREILRWIFSS